jgi:photosystem II stability/assembly factor-like uncharacterized protein
VVWAGAEETEDGGVSWQRQDSGTTQWLDSVAFVTPQSGWTVGYEGTILHTENGGSSWQKQDSGTTMDFRSVAFVAPQTGWVVGGKYNPQEGAILRTEDGGRSW